MRTAAILGASLLLLALALAAPGVDARQACTDALGDKTCEATLCYWDHTLGEWRCPVDLPTRCTVVPCDRPL